jgi:hypothetical protein
MRHIPLLLALWLSFAAFGGQVVDEDCPWDYLLGSPRVGRPTNDTAVELELDMSPQLMRLFTTTTGTLAPLLEKKTPPKVLAWIAKNASRYRDRPGDLPWDRLPFELKKEMIRAVSQGQDFYQDRLIHGLRMRDKVHVVFNHRTYFLGKWYEKGAQDLPTKGVLMEKVEHEDAGTIKNAGGAELHFRVRVPAGDAAVDAWTLLQGLGIPRDHLHVHIVNPLPMTALKADPDGEAFHLTDFVRRANLLAEMISIYEGAPILRREHGTEVIFAYYKAEELSEVQRFFAAAGRGEPARIADTTMGWASARSSDKYDEPGLWGIEYRAISDDTPPELVRAVLNGLQYDMRKNDLGISPKHLKDWQKAHPGRNIESLWYHRSEPLAAQGESLPADARKLLGHRRVQAALKKDDAVRLLAYNWADDPLVWGNAELVEKIEQARQSALEALIDDQMDTSDVLREFLADSGLLEATAASLNMRQVSDALEDWDGP